MEDTDTWTQGQSKEETWCGFQTRSNIVWLLSTAELTAHLAVYVLVGVEAEEAPVVRQRDEVHTGHAGPQTVLQCRYLDICLSSPYWPPLT